MAEISPLRRRMIEDMTVRNLSPATQRCAPRCFGSAARRYVDASAGYLVNSQSSAAGGIRSCSRGALGYTRCTIAADQRFEKCSKNPAALDKCSHAVSKAEGISAKNQSIAGGTLFVDR
jgi:phage tail tape-measure protein